MKPFRVAAVQMTFRAAIPENVEAILTFIQTARRNHVDAILFPECAITGYWPEFTGIDHKALAEGHRAVAEAARHCRCHVLIGSPRRQKRKWFNSLLVFDKRGREIFSYDKIHLTESDARFFSRGNSLALFTLSGVPATAIICHERRYPELVRIPVMMGARIVFHPNAGLDPFEVSKRKRGGRDGIAVRAFENQVFYVFANSVGPQGNGLWSAGDSKIVAPDSSVLALANNRDEGMIYADLDLKQAGRQYALEAMGEPAFLRGHWKRMIAACQLKRIACLNSRNCPMC